MADFIYQREGAPESVFIVLRVPRLLWDRWEYRHKHFGAALFALRSTVVELMAIRGLREDLTDRGDPFWSGR